MSFAPPVSLPACFTLSIHLLSLLRFSVFALWSHFYSSALVPSSYVSCLRYRYPFHPADPGRLLYIRFSRRPPLLFGRVSHSAAALRAAISAPEEETSRPSEAKDVPGGRAEASAAVTEVQRRTWLSDELGRLRGRAGAVGRACGGSKVSAGKTFNRPWLGDERRSLVSVTRGNPAKPGRQRGEGRC